MEEEDFAQIKTNIKKYITDSKQYKISEEPIEI